MIIRVVSGKCLVCGPNQEQRRQHGHQMLLFSTKSPKACEPHLVDTVQELQEDGGEAAALAAQSLRPPVAEPVAERQPLFLHQQPEAVEGPVVGIRQQLHQGHHLQARRGATDSVNLSLLGREKQLRTRAGLLETVCLAISSTRHRCCTCV